MSYAPLGLEDLMPFGKHKGTKIRVLIMNEFPYMRWLLSENENLTLDNAAYEKFKQQESNYDL